jgi:hypothetical protein
MSGPIVAYRKPTIRFRSQPLFLTLMFMGILFLAGLYTLYPRIFPKPELQQGVATKTAVTDGNTVAMRSATVTDQVADAVALHIRNADRNSNAVIANLRQAQARLKSMQADLAREYLTIDTNRLDRTNALIETAVRQARQTSEEMRIAQDVLNNR